MKYINHIGDQKLGPIAFNYRWVTLILFLSMLSLIPWWLHDRSSSIQNSWAKNVLKIPVSIKDKGIFSDLDQSVEVSIPSWLPPNELRLRSWLDSNQQSMVGLFYREALMTLLPSDQGIILPKAFELISALNPKLTETAPQPLPKSYLGQHDHDHDGIFDPLDIHLGSVKTVINGAQYQEGYEHIKYPLGDVSREIGVCTDVVVRAFRNAGWDLQELLYKDMKARPKAYGLRGKRPNRHIDHRRVRRLIVYFKKYYKSLPIIFDPKQSGDEAWLPGDLVFMDTLNKGRSTHVGLVSDKLGWDGKPLIINNWTYGYQTSEMSLSDLADYLYRFRITFPK